MYLEWLKNKLGEKFYPITHSKAVIYDESGKSIQEVLSYRTDSYTKCIHYQIPAEKTKIIITPKVYTNQWLVGIITGYDGTANMFQTNFHNYDGAVHEFSYANVLGSIKPTKNSSNGILTFILSQHRTGLLIITSNDDIEISYE